MHAASRLPTELWQQIFSFAALEDKPQSFVDLWVSGRQVCKAWRAQIAQTYLDTFIRNPSCCFIAFDCGIRSFEVMGKYVWPMQMVFDRFDPDDKSRCVFKESAETFGKLPDTWGRKQREKYRDSKYETWAKELERYMNDDQAERWANSSDEDNASAGEDEPDQDEEKAVDSADGNPTSDGDQIDEFEIEASPKNFERPAHVLYIYGVANDTELPALYADIEKAEISFEWEGMLTGLIMERAELRRRTDRRIQEIKEECNAKLPSGVEGPEDVEAVVVASKKVKAVVSKRMLRVRRERIVNAFKKRGRKEFRDGTWEFGWDSFDGGYERTQLRRIEEAEVFGESDREDVD